MARRVVLLGCALLLLAAACGGGGEDASMEESGASAGGDAAVEAERGADGAGLAEEAAPQAAAPAEDAAGDEGPLPQAITPGGPERIIKRGTITIEVEEGRFDAAVSRVTQAAADRGGSIVSSTTQTQEDDGGTFGAVTVRVPVEQYDALLAAVGDLGVGEILGRDISSEDVSAEFVDLEARQRNLEAQERFYLGLLEDATGVSDAIAVQQQLSGITEQLEQIKGRLQFLDERTRFSTLTVELFEPGAGGALAEEEPAGPSLGRSWQLAKDAFLNVVGALLVIASFSLPLVVIAAVVVVTWRLVRPRREQRPQPPPPTIPAAPPPPAPDRESEPVS